MLSPPAGWWCYSLLNVETQFCFSRTFSCEIYISVAFHCCANTFGYNLHCLSFLHSRGPSWVLVQANTQQIYTYTWASTRRLQTEDKICITVIERIFQSTSWALKSFQTCKAVNINDTPAHTFPPCFRHLFFLLVFSQDTLAERKAGPWEAGTSCTSCLLQKGSEFKHTAVLHKPAQGLAHQPLAAIMAQKQPFISKWAPCVQAGSSAGMLL